MALNAYQVLFPCIAKTMSKVGGILGLWSVMLAGHLTCSSIFFSLYLSTNTIPTLKKTKNTSKEGARQEEREV